MTVFTGYPSETTRTKIKSKLKRESPETWLVDKGSTLEDIEQCLEEKARGRRGRGWGQRTFVARSRICRTLYHIKTQETSRGPGRWADRYLHSTYDDVNTEKRDHEEGPARKTATNRQSPTKRFTFASATWGDGESFLWSTLQNVFQGRRYIHTAYTVVANAISVLLPSHLRVHASLKRCPVV